MRVPGRAKSWAVLCVVLLLTIGAAACSVVTAPKTSRAKTSSTSRAGRGGSLESTTLPTTSTTEAPASGPQVTLAYAGGGVGIVGMVTEPEGEAAPHLYLTHDFEHFTDVTPPAVLEGSVSGTGAFEQAFFLNPEDGWVSTFNGASAQVDVYRTTDGGLSWTPVAGTTHTIGAGAVTYLQFLSPTFGYLDNLQPTAPAADLSVSHDGGLSWQPVATSPGPSQLPIGRAVFIDASHGVAVANAFACGPTSTSNVWTTSNGGTSWAPAELPTPFVPSATVAICPDTPFVAAKGEMVVPASLTVTHASAHVDFVVSTDEGQSWRAAPGPPATFQVVSNPSVLGDVGRAAGGAAVAAGSWWVVGKSTSGSDQVWVTRDQGAHWDASVAQGLPSGGALSDVIAITDRQAWVVTSRGPNAYLYTTSDSGAAWAELSP
jgi:hypothetical protein